MSTKDTWPQLPSEDDEGNTEYKLKLINPTQTRFDRLVTQMNFRLIEGGGEALYEIGVSDDGTPTGISPEEMEASLETLQRMAGELSADITVIRRVKGISGEVAEVLVRQICGETHGEIRVTITGNVDSGKTSLLGVLTKGILDNGRGLARSSVFTFKHELESGRTSAVGREYLGFDSHGEIVNEDKKGGLKTPTEAEITERSSKIINFIDLAGHEKYLKTTVFGMSGHAPDYTMLVAGANMGLNGMAKEHLGIALALHVPVFVIVTKIDICPENIFKETMSDLTKILKSPGCRKLPVIVRKDDDVVVCARNFTNDRVCPIFCISNVTGVGLSLLKKFLNLLPARVDWSKFEKEPIKFDIDTLYSVPGVGTVVSGTLFSGTIKIGDKVKLGPDGSGNFTLVTCRSIYTKCLAVKKIKAGQTATINIPKIKKNDLRTGMVMLDSSVDPSLSTCWEFEAELLILFHSTTIHKGYEAVVHCRTVKQTARIIELDKECIRTGDKAQAKLRFRYRPEYVTIGSRFIFREGRTRGIGKVLSLG